MNLFKLKFATLPEGNENDIDNPIIEEENAPSSVRSASSVSNFKAPEAMLTEAESGENMNNKTTAETVKAVHYYGGTSLKRILDACNFAFFCNDLCASVWFIYLSYYLIFVSQLSELVTATIFLLSFLADGVTTSIISRQVSRESLKSHEFKYILSSVITYASFMCVFTVPQFRNPMVRNCWFIIWSVIFNVGLVIVQTENASLTRHFSEKQSNLEALSKQRKMLNQAAYGVVLCLSLALFFFTNHTDLQFRLISVTCVTLGGLATLNYLCLVHETQPTSQAPG